MDKDIFTPKSDISMLEIESSYKLMEKDKKIMKLKCVRDQIGREMRQREEKMSKLQIKIGVYEQELSLAPTKTLQNFNPGTSNPNVDWTENMSELGSDNMSIASISLAGTLKSRRDLTNTNLSLGKRSFEDIGVSPRRKHAEI